MPRWLWKDEIKKHQEKANLHVARAPVPLGQPYLREAESGSTIDSQGQKVEPVSRIASDRFNFDLPDDHAEQCFKKLLKLTPLHVLLEH